MTRKTKNLNAPPPAARPQFKAMSAAAVQRRSRMLAGGWTFTDIQSAANAAAEYHGESPLSRETVRQVVNGAWYNRHVINAYCSLTGTEPDDVFSDRPDPETRRRLDADERERHAAQKQMQRAERSERAKVRALGAALRKTTVITLEER